MKSGKKPNKAQSIFIAENGFNSKEFFVERDTPKEMVIINKNTGKLEIIPKK